MSDQKTNSSPVLGAKERYNPCMQCGGDLVLRVDDYNEYYLQCTRCETGIGTDIVPIPGHDPVEVCRYPYNKNTLSEMFSNASLARLGVENGDYIVTEVSDDFIVFVGDGRNMLYFLAAEDNASDYRFNIYRLKGHFFENVGVYIRHNYA